MNKHLKFYNQCMKTGRLPKLDSSGLCGCAKHGYISKELLEVFEPTAENRMELEFEELSIGWWASGVSLGDESLEDESLEDESLEDEKMFGFTNLRQTIIEFMMVIEIEEFQ